MKSMLQGQPLPEQEDAECGMCRANFIFLFFKYIHTYTRTCRLTNWAMNIPDKSSLNLCKSCVFFTISKPTFFTSSQHRMSYYFLSSGAGWGRWWARFGNFTYVQIKRIIQFQNHLFMTSDRKHGNAQITSIIHVSKLKKKTACKPSTAVTNHMSLIRCVMES